MVTSWRMPAFLRIWMALPEKPHCGNWAVPFMNSTTGCSLTVWCTNSLASMVYMG